ncbi:hypothetical protein L2D08_03515 [Domibacillus sp. PGB-M46]|uniref:hypothetical protein n=1 Tax=Domibacillus sp. PGB-M46 TaxID=2910255 RepID=UPI001F5AD36A|nr:hypothetical protein [Domibacillus sp. PGB-M46]MCI2253429.1 hypothetical protein [Domibacillus sp. PGB-M46]
MNFIHCTNTKAAKKILRTKRINESYFDYEECLDYWLVRLARNTSNLPGKYYYIDPDWETALYVYWLGKGVYCFSEDNSEMASRYAKLHRHDTIINIAYDSDYSYFNLTERLDEVTALLKNEVLKHFEEKKNSDAKLLEAATAMVELLLLTIEDEFYEDPYAAAILIGLFLDFKDEEYDVVSNQFLKKNLDYYYDEYHSIRNTSKIKDISHHGELSNLARS